jgi:hypothetical protein
MAADPGASQAERDNAKKLAAEMRERAKEE